MNYAWLVSGFFCLVTGLFRTIGFIQNRLPSIFEDGTEPRIAAWFVTVWLIVSGLFFFGAAVFFFIGVTRVKLSYPVVGYLLSAIFLATALVIFVANLYMWSLPGYDISVNPTYLPIIPLTLIAVFGLWGSKIAEKRSVA